MKFNENEVKIKIDKLISNIKKWNIEYYDNDAPSVSDFIYDQALLELEMLEKAFPNLVREDSPTAILGSSVDNRFKKVAHKKPMLSLNKAYSFDDVIKYINNIQKIIKNVEFILFAEPKIDGLSISIIYEKGILVKALTRGNGIIGEDVTHNVLMIDSIPKKIQYENDLEVRGEIYIPKDKFEQLNKMALANNQKLFANARNAASGSLRQLEANISKERGLEAIIYQVVEPLSHNIFDTKTEREFLKNQGFKTQEFFEKITSQEQLKNVIDSFKNIKNNFNYDCDGLVIKYYDFRWYETLGYTAKFPHHSIAFKYEIEKAITKLIDIVASVGRTGRITYNAILEPVELNQTIVSAATLHNYNYIVDNKINIGEDVYVIKAGEIIPRVVAPVFPKEKSYFKIIKQCPNCGNKLQKIDDNVDQFCLNSECSTKKIRAIIHYCSREALNINELGEKQIEKFFNLNILNEIKDIYFLYQKRDFLNSLGKKVEKSTNNLIENIEKSKKCNLFQVIFGLGIKHIGLQSSKVIAKKINKLQDLFGFSYNELINLDDLGEKSAIEIINFVADEKNKKLMVFLDKTLSYNKNESNEKFKNLIFVITGTLSKNRDEYKKIIENSSGKISSSISKNTNYLLCGDNAGSKLEKAIKLGIKVINENEFEELLNN
ncbi:NAD-dependent DNA ligase LigA [Mycoplasma sp. M5725]|uniref:DNA ligase n=1 Tax=Mycoplasma phocimorsus TaxID=3045839 RepID=A0AAJ1PUC5_9MOLU|nr:NAD-dependent DNA ligase LigA [Mycoplasma phocimorsus]MDJ1646010.1 NAD-dependent DNA ligase LigA [Mycoplasma phocimorsus]